MPSPRNSTTSPSPVLPPPAVKAPGPSPRLRAGALEPRAGKAGLTPPGRTPARQRPGRSPALQQVAVAHEAIARRAYQIFEARGGSHGHDLDDWLRAERELLAEPPAVQA